MLKTNASYEANKPEVEKFVVRLPGGMRGRIAAVARQSRRSMNSEIIARLEQSLAEVSAVQPLQETPLQRPALRAIEASSSDETEQRLLRAFRKLPPGKREAILGFLE